MPGAAGAPGPKASFITILLTHFPLENDKIMCTFVLFIIRKETKLWFRIRLLLDTVYPNLVSFYFIFIDKNCKYETSKSFSSFTLHNGFKLKIINLQGSPGQDGIVKFSL